MESQLQARSQGAVRSDSPQLSVLLHECDARRGEIQQVIKSQHQAIFGFISISAVGIGLFATRGVFDDSSTRTIVLLVISQAQILLCLHLTALISLLNVNAACSAAIEEQINTLLDKNLCLWDSEVAPGFLFSPRRSFLWINVAMTALVGWFDAQCIVLTFQRGLWVYGVLLILEVFIVLGFWVLCLFEHTKVAQYTKRRLQEQRGGAHG
ncbi:MAG TPA: hypothetical protein VNE39_25100 [Planctomycetota bacterium]|nr:hypothetical protein [Planctomycetota bacterium]